MGQENKCTLVEASRGGAQFRFTPECAFAMHSRRNTDRTKDNYSKVI